MLLSQSFTAHTHESCQQKAGPEQMLEVWDLMLLKDILMHPIVHIFYRFIAGMNLPTAISPLMHRSPYSFAYPKTSFQVLTPASSTVTRIHDHPHQHKNICCLMYSHSYTARERLSAPISLQFCIISLFL